MPILVDDGPYDAPLPRSIKQVLQHRQRYVEKMDFILESLTTYIRSTVDSDRSGDYDSVAIGEKRTFKDFVRDELDDSDQRKSLVKDLA